MKRCPQCLFLYPESDEKCDFDQTPLEILDDAEIERATNPSKPRHKALPVAVVIGLLLGAIIFAIYYGLNKRTPTTSAAAQTSVTVEPSPKPSPDPAPSLTISPSPSPSPSPKTSSNGVATAHTRASTDPVSTSGPGMGTRQGSKPVIVLTSGGKIDADEVWRTRDGVWYRRNGMVTLLKRSQVKAIATR
jgi:hypothetical protein